jgi:hypothetical protein
MLVRLLLARSQLLHRLKSSYTLIQQLFSSLPNKVLQQAGMLRLTSGFLCSRMACLALPFAWRSFRGAARHLGCGFHSKGALAAAPCRPIQGWGCRQHQWWQACAPPCCAAALGRHAECPGPVKRGGAYAGR